MELRHLRYFIAVAEESTLVAAAQRLRIAQPALTRQIHDLEREIDVELFTRGARGVELTPAGDVCLVTARHILSQVEVAMRHARGSSAGIAGRCVICAGTRALASGLIARIVARVHSRYPTIDLVVIEGAGERQWKALQLVEADIGIGVHPSSEYGDLSSETADYDLFDAVAVSSSHVLAARSSVALSDLRDDTFLTWHPKLMGEAARHQKAEFKRVGFKPVRTREFHDPHSLVTMVAAGQGWTFIPRSASNLAAPGTVIIPLSDFKLPVPHVLLWRHSEQRPVVRTVLGVVRQLMAEERQAAGRGGADHAPMTLPPPVSAAAHGDDGNAAPLELRHLRYFCAVAESKSFGRAAERLELTQPALSRQVRDLERAVGVDLLERAARGATVTPAGESFFRSARRILDEVEALPAEAHRARRGTLARCVVATLPTPSAMALIHELVRRCAHEVPQMELLTYEYHTPAQPAALRSATVDIGLCHASPMSPVDERGLRRERLVDDLVSCALVSTDSSLASRTAIDFSDLADVPFVFPSRSFQPALYDQLFAIFDGFSYRPRVEGTYDGLKTAWAMVAEGRGWGIGFSSQCADPPAGTVAVPVTGFAMPWGLDVLYREDESRTLILLVLEILHDIARAHEQQRTVA